MIKPKKIIVDLVMLRQAAFRQGFYRMGHALGEAEKAYVADMTDKLTDTASELATTYLQSNLKRVVDLVNKDATVYFCARERGRGVSPKAEDLLRPARWWGYNWVWFLSRGCKPNTLRLELKRKIRHEIDKGKVRVSKRKRSAKLR